MSARSGILSRILLATGCCLLLATLVASRSAGTTSAPAVIPEATVQMGTVTVVPSSTPWYNYVVNPTKRAFLEHGEQTTVAEITASALTPRPTHPPGTPTPVYPSSPALDQTPAGAGTIIDSGQAPISSAAFIGENLWFETGEDHLLAVCAGVDGQDATQGLLAVILTSLDSLHTLPGGGFYPTPLKVGPVRITGAVGERLTLQAADGTHFTFDVPTRQWVNP